MSDCTRSKGRLQILLSTYNGARYLEEQLESCRDMARAWPCQFLIRDDGSTDETRQILERYAQEENVEVVYGEHVGLNASYMWLAEHSDPACAYYAICDQDDRWFPNKAITAARLLEREDTSGEPLLFASRSVLTDEALRPVGETALPRRGLTFYNAMLQNSCPGHTQILNRPLMERLKRSCHPDMAAFDWWVYLLAAAFGRVVFSPEPTVWHRQHRNNSVGYPATRRAVFMGRAARVLRGDGKAVSKQLQGLLDCAGPELPEAYRTEVERFLKGRMSFSARIWYFFYGNVYRQSKLDSFLFRWIYLFGGY